jgi:hypothetical protein
MIKRQRRRFALLVIGLSSGLFSHAQSHPTQLEVPHAPIPIHVLVQSPADTRTELQVICLFQSTPENKLHGALSELNEKLGGAFDRIRKPEKFAGALGETLLLTPPAGKISARQLLIVGLGDSNSFTPEKMELAGTIVYSEANSLGVKDPYFAPTVLDGGVTKFTTGEISEWFIRGFLRGWSTEKELAASGYGNGSEVTELTYLAGPTHANDTRDGIVKAISEMSAQ